MNAALQFKRWLVVDDDPTLLALTAQVLRTLPGGEVVACDDPQRALGLFLAAPESFEILVTDFDMPVLNGFGLASRVRAQAPRLPVLVLSGSGLQVGEVLAAGLDAFLAKPFLPKDLLEAVRILIGSRRHHGRGTSRGESLAPRISPVLTAAKSPAAPVPEPFLMNSR